MSEFTDINLPKKNKEGDYNMCKAVEELKAEGRLEGRAEGTLDTLVSLVRDGLLSADEAAKRADLSLEAFQEKLKTDSKN